LLSGHGDDNYRRAKAREQLFMIQDLVMQRSLLDDSILMTGLIPKSSFLTMTISPEEIRHCKVVIQRIMYLLEFSSIDFNIAVHQE
jgi:hypothetical protein